ncbi:hypothetical protein AB4Z52_18540 [Rhizobium sp. 2YAF20]
MEPGRRNHYAADAGSALGDDHKEYFARDVALKAAREHNTMNQFAA